MASERSILVGNVAVGGGAPVSIQSMCNTPTQDVEKTVAQILKLEQAGCQIIRVAVPDMAAADAVRGIVERIHIPLVADVHFDWRLAVRAAERGAHALRVNPGNIGGQQNVRRVADAARAHHVPIRVGVNAGSLEKELLEQYGPTPEALVQSALSHLKMLEDAHFYDAAVSIKASDVKTTVEAALAEEPISEEHAALQAEVQAQWDAYKADGRTDLFDTKEWYALQTWNGGDQVADLDLVKQMANLSYDGLKWIESLGMEFRNSIGQGAGSLWQRTHTSIMQQGTGFLSTYVNCIANSDKITMLLSTTGTKLIQDESGRVTGVVCTDKAGNTFNISAAKGVILATGGFAANSKMVQENNTSGKWSDLSKVATTNRFQCSQGDGITMAVEAGASLTDMDQIQLLYLGNIVNGQITKYPQRDVSGTDQIIFINKEGKRFVNEGARRDVICLASFEQTDGMFYMLESGDGDQYVDIHSDEWRSADGFTFSYLEENGYVIAAETLEELAEKLGCQYEDLKATLDAFNESVETGVDEFGRTLYSTKLENGPWVATPRQACVHHTMGGVTIDPETHVLDTDGNAIPGLYAAGEITGGIHGANRLGGNAVVDTVVFGKLAGENAATEQ